MKYFIDTEFIEGFHKPILGKKRHFIDLISIGIVCEDGRAYYAISNEYSYNKSDQWVRENVILPIYKSTAHGDARNRWNIENFHQHYGKSNAEIAEEIIMFTDCWRINMPNPKVEFYGYYADYDWVLFCSLFGRMIDLPKGFPMYCRDLKQMFDEIGLTKEWKQINCPDPKDEHNALVDAKWNMSLYQMLNKEQGHSKIVNTPQY